MIGEWIRHPDPPVVYLGNNWADGGSFLDTQLPHLKCLCVAYFYRERNRYYEHLVACLPKLFREGRSCFLDSGAFTFLASMTEERELGQYLKGYIEFVSSCGFRFDFCVTFDYKPHAPTVYQITKKLWKMGLAAVPVYHGDSSIDWLKRYIDDGHKLIGISRRWFVKDLAEVRRFYDQVFNLTEREREREFPVMVLLVRGKTWLFTLGTRWTRRLGSELQGKAGFCGNREIIW